MIESKAKHDRLCLIIYPNCDFKYKLRYKLPNGRYKNEAKLCTNAKLCNNIKLYHQPGNLSDYEDEYNENNPSLNSITTESEISYAINSTFHNIQPNNTVHVISDEHDVFGVSFKIYFLFCTILISGVLFFLIKYLCIKFF